MSGAEDIRDRFAAAEEVRCTGAEEMPSAPPGGSLPPRDPGEPADGPPPAAQYPLNDLGNAQRFKLHFGSSSIFAIRAWWYVYDGCRWQKDEAGHLIRKFAQRISPLIEEEIEHLTLSSDCQNLLDEEPRVTSELRRLSAVSDPTPEDETARDAAERKVGAIRSVRKRLDGAQQAHRRFGTSSGNTSRITAMIQEASTMLSVSVDELDAQPLEVNSLSGTLAFRVVREEGMSSTADFELRPHRREDLITKLMPVAHDPQAAAPRFEAFLERVLPDPDVRGFLQRWFGLSMTDLTGDQKLVFLHGAGANGKTVLVEFMARMLGDYAARAKIESLTGRNRRGGGDATPDLVPLIGARMVRASEPDQGERLQEGLIKELTGGEPIQVRALHSDFVEVEPRFKLTMSGNHRPEIRGTDDGIWRRVLLVPFEVQIPPAEGDPDLGEKLWAERSGVLNWMIEGLLDYLERGLAEPAAVLLATQAYREDSDPMHVFLAECCVVSGQETDFTRSRDLIDAFNFWLEEKGETRWSGRTISLRLKDKASRWRDPSSGRALLPRRST